MLSRFVPHRTVAFVAIEAWFVLLARLTKAAFLPATEH